MFSSEAMLIVGFTQFSRHFCVERRFIRSLSSLIISFHLRIALFILFTLLKDFLPFEGSEQEVKVRTFGWRKFHLSPSVWIISITSHGWSSRHAA